MKKSIKKSISLLCVAACLSGSFFSRTVFATEKNPMDIEIIEEKGATDYYYVTQDWKISNKRNRTYVGKKTFTNGISFSVSTPYGGKVTIESKVSGTYKIYSYYADFTFIAKKMDSMGHYLGTKTFKNNGVKCYEYISV